VSPQKSRRRKAQPARSRVPVIVAVVISLLILVALALPYKRKNGVGRAVDIEVFNDTTDSELVAKLDAAGVIDSPTFFSLYAKTRGGLGAKRGRHLLSDDLSPAEVLRRLRRSPDATKVHVTIPEGFHRFDIAKRLKEKRVCDDAAFLSATNDQVLLNELGIPSAEGWLFPATYDLPANADATDVVRRMVAEGKARIDKLLKANAAPTMSVPEVIALASIVEKEAVVDDERPIIASVFLNRLRDTKETGGRLEADPTAGYGCLASQPPTPTCMTWLAAGSTKVSAAIQHDPYNKWSTYTHAGLPPTPICNPGEKSIAAVLAPANTKYFYFVAKGGGRHTFSETKAAHDAAVHH
jgi:UPF0755 protein